MATQLSNLLALLSLDESAYLKGLDSSKKASDSFVGSLANVGGAVVLGALTAIATGVVTVGGVAFDAAEKVDEAFDSIAVSTGAQGDELAQLQDDWKAVFSTVPTDAGLAADVIGILNSRLDITGETLQNLTIPLLEVSRLLKTDAVQNAENFTRVIGDWNIPVENAAGSLDSLFLATQQTGAPLDTLMQQIVQYGAPMRNFGFTFEESAALLASFAAQGVNTEIVMSGLRIAQGKFITQGKDMSTGLWETIDAIKNATSHTDALAIATEIFGAKAAGDLVDTIRAGKFDLDSLVESMMNADGAIMDAAAATSDWGEKWKVFQNKMTIALAPIGEKLREGFGSALDSLVEIFNRPDVQNSIAAFADFAVDTIGKIVENIPTFIEGIQTFFTYLQNNQGIVIGIFAALGVAALTWGVVTAAAAWTAIAPLLPVIGVILLIAGAAYLLYEAWANNWGGIQEKVMAVWAFLEPIFQNIVTWFQTNIPLAIQAVSAFWTDTLLPAIQSVWSWLSTVLFPFFISFGNFFQAVFNVALTTMAGIWQNVLQPALDAVFGQLQSDLMPAFQSLAEFWSNTLQPIVESIANWIGGQVVQSFQNLTSIIQGVTGWLSTLADQLNSMSLPAWMTPGSPTPWEIGLLGVADAMQALSRSELPSLESSLNIQSNSAAVPVSTATVGVGGGDNVMLEEVRRMLHDLPNEIARAVTNANAKGQKR